MKKKFITGLVALCVTAATAFTMVGCAEESSPLSKNEFIEGVKASYDAFYAAHNDVDNFEDMQFTIDNDISFAYNIDWEYTPDGAEEPVKETYTNYNQIEEILTVDAKNIQDELFVSVNYISVSQSTSYDPSTADKTLPLVATKSVSKQTSKWEFGVIEGIYYARLTKTAASATDTENDPLLGEPTTSKTYYVFQNDIEYDNAISSILNEYNGLYIEDAFATTTASYYNTVTPEYSKSGDVYILDMKDTMGSIDQTLKEYGIATRELHAEFGEEGCNQYYSYANAYSDSFEANMEATCNFDYSSSLVALNNPFVGYTLNNSLNYNAAVVIISDGSNFFPF